jgi:hypothetical protein
VNLLKKKKILIMFIYAVILLMSISIITPAMAIAKGFYNEQTVIAEKQIIDNFVVIGADATIYGSVKDAVIILNGNLEIKESARIMGVVVVIGGNIRQDPGAQITDNVINIKFNDLTVNGLLIGTLLFVGTRFLLLICSMFFVILPALLVVFAKKQIEPFVGRVKSSPGRLLVIGFFSNLLIMAISLLLSFSIVGIPFVLLLFILVLTIFLFGLTVISLLIGESLIWTSGKPSWFVTAVGAIIVVSCMNFPLFGGLLLLCILWISIGMAALWIWERRKEKPAA